MIIQFNSAAGDQESTDRTATTLWSKRHAVADRPAAGVHGPTRLPARLASDSRRGLCTATTREAVGRVDMNVGFLNEEMLVSSTFNCQLNHAPCRTRNLGDPCFALQDCLVLQSKTRFALQNAGVSKVFFLGDPVLQNTTMGFRAKQSPRLRKVLQTPVLQNTTLGLRLVQAPHPNEYVVSH